MTKREDEEALKVQADLERRIAALKGTSESVSDSELYRRTKQLNSIDPVVPHRKRPATLGADTEVADLLNQVYDELEVEDNVDARDKRGNANFAADVTARLAKLHDEPAPAAHAAKVRRHTPVVASRAAPQATAAKINAQKEADLARSLAALRNKQPGNTTPPPTRPAAQQPTRYYPSTWVSPNPTPPAVEEKTGIWNFIKKIGQAIARSVSSLFSSAPKTEQESAPSLLAPAVQQQQQPSATATATEPTVNGSKPRDGIDIYNANATNARASAWRANRPAEPATGGANIPGKDVKRGLSELKSQATRDKIVLNTNDKLEDEHNSSERRSFYQKK